MARARVKGTEFEVRVVRDLADNYAVQLVPPQAPRDARKPKSVARAFEEPPSELVIKVMADNAEAALKTGLELLKQYGKIDDFVI